MLWHMNICQGVKILVLGGGGLAYIYIYVFFVILYTLSFSILDVLFYYILIQSGNWLDPFAFFSWNLAAKIDIQLSWNRSGAWALDVSLWK